MKKNLYLLRGIPASGKTSWVKNNNFENYTISSDKIRLLFPQPIHNEITQMFNNKVWNIVFDLMEQRMILSQPIIIDATHCKKKDIKKYNEYCEKYHYEIVIVDFTSVKILKECIICNGERERQVPIESIEKMFNTVKDNEKEIAKEYRVISIEEAKECIKRDIEEYIKPIDNNDLKKFIDEIREMDVNFRDAKELEDIIEKIKPIVLKTFPLLEIEKDYDQNNPYYFRNLLEHSIDVLIRFMKEAKKYNYKPLDEDVIACLFHDIGKPLVACKNHEGWTTYYGHGKVGEEMFRTMMGEKIKGFFNSPFSIPYICEFIRIHDEKPRESKLFYDSYKAVYLFHIADGSAHNMICDKDGKIKERISKAKEELKK